MALQHPVDTTPADLLRSARQTAWSNDESAAPDAYNCAIKAIECAFVPVMEGDDIHYNLADLVATFRSRREPWGTPFRNESALDSIMSLLGDLWNARPYKGDLIPVSLENANMAITIAEAVVSLVEQGFFEYLGELTPEELAEDQRVVDEYLERKRRGEVEETIPWEEFVGENWSDEADA